MTLRYVGPGGNDANDGLSWANRKLTLNGVEDTPVAAGDTVYVGPGTYRELLTVDVSGTAGNIISYIGDYTGANTDGTGGVVRITGSDNDQTTTRANCIGASTKNYRTFRGLHLDGTTGAMASLSITTYFTIDQCFFGERNHSQPAVTSSGAGQSNMTISNCFHLPNRFGMGINFTHSAAVDNAAHVVSNCILLGSHNANIVSSTRVGGITVRNCLIMGGSSGVAVGTLTAGQTVTVNNCIITACNVGFAGSVTGDITENYNTLFGNGTDRTNTDTGANSLAYMPCFDSRWFFQLVNAVAGIQVITPFDLASYSDLINVAGTSPTATDMRGTSAITEREWGALEYNSALNIAGGAGGGFPILGGSVVR